MKIHHAIQSQILSHNDDFFLVNGSPWPRCSEVAHLAYIPQLPLSFVDKPIATPLVMPVDIQALTENVWPVMSLMYPWVSTRMERCLQASFAGESEP